MGCFVCLFLVCVGAFVFYFPESFLWSKDQKENLNLWDWTLSKYSVIMKQFINIMWLSGIHSFFLCIVPFLESSNEIFHLELLNFFCMIPDELLPYPQNNAYMRILAISLTLKKFFFLALAGMAQWIECRPANQRVASLIPSQGTCLGYGPGPH